MRPSFAARAERGALAADTLVGLPAPYPAAYADVWLGLLRARAVLEATRLGVWGALPGSTEEIADRCGCDAARLEVLLEALAALRYVRGRWRATRRARAHFGPDAAAPLEATVGALSTSAWEVMRGLGDVMRGGAPPGLHDGAADADTFAGYQAAMDELVRLSAPQVLARLRHPERVLDIGGGPGTFARLVCQRWPRATVTVAEFADAARLGRERVVDLGDRVRYIDGDARTSDLGRGYDVATLLSVLHNVDRSTGVELLAAARRAAPRTVVGEIEAGATQLGTLSSLVFCAWMGTRTRTAAELATMAREAGFTRVRVRRPARLAGLVLLECVA